MYNIDILRWSVGAPLSLQMQDNYDEQTTLSYVVGSGFIFHFLQAILQDRPKWCTATMFMRSIAHTTCLRHHWERRLDIVGEFYAALDPDRDVPIVFGGYAAYTLLDARRSVPLQYDIALLHDDPAYLKKVLAKMGFEDSEAADSSDSYAVVANGDIRFILYRSIPVWRYWLDTMLEEAAGSQQGDPVCHNRVRQIPVRGIM